MDKRDRVAARYHDVLIVYPVVKMPLANPS